MRCTSSDSSDTILVKVGPAKDFQRRPLLLPCEALATCSLRVSADVDYDSLLERRRDRRVAFRAIDFGVKGECRREEQALREVQLAGNCSHPIRLSGE